MDKNGYNLTEVNRNVHWQMKADTNEHKCHLSSGHNLMDTPESKRTLHRVIASSCKYACSGVFSPSWFYFLKELFNKNFKRKFYLPHKHLAFKSVELFDFGHKSWDKANAQRNDKATVQDCWFQFCRQWISKMSAPKSDCAFFFHINQNSSYFEG